MGRARQPRREGGNMTQKKVFALLAFDRDDSLEDLRLLLKAQAIETWTARTCEEVVRLLDQTQPELIFTGKRLFDGTWIDIVDLTEKAHAPTNVIVVGECEDARLSLSTMQYGAFDFIFPPFEAGAMAHLMRVAAENIRRRREEQAVNAVA